MFNFTSVIVRAVPRTFTQAFRWNLNASINLHQAKVQHGKYVAHLRRLVKNVHYLSPDMSLPSSPLVESTAVVIDNKAIINSMSQWPCGRTKEVDEVTKTLLMSNIDVYKCPKEANLDGSDVLQTKDGIIVGLSTKTNKAGCDFLKYVTKQPVFSLEMPFGYTLKSCVTLLDEKTVVVPESSLRPAKGLSVNFDKSQVMFDVVVVPNIQCSNIMRIAGTVFIPAGYPKSEAILREACEKRGLKCVVLDINEFIKADGHMSAMSILF